MQYPTITAAACTAAFALSGMASADIQVPLRVLNSTYDASRPLSALLGTGYATKYVSRGLAFQQSGSDHVVPVEAIGAYDLNKKYSILAGVKYQWLTQNDLTHNSTGISDEATALLGVSRKFSDYTMASLGYQFVNGGLPGLMLKADDDEGHYRFTADGLEQSHGTEPILFGGKDYQPVDRKQYDKMQKRFAADPVGFITGIMPNVKITVQDNHGNKTKNPKDTPYNPIER